MQPHKRSIYDLFDGKRRYVVPLFQRQYVWTKDNDWEPLWEDLERKFVRVLKDGDAGNPHFLGAIVIDQKKSFGNSPPRHLVIDGQQRLTTFQLFLAAFRDLARANGVEAWAEECNMALLNSGVMQDKATEQYKVWPTEKDRAQFCTIIDAGSRESVKEAFPLTRKKYARKPDPRPRMVECYLYFHDQLQQFLDDEYYEGTVEDKTERVFHALRTSLQVVSVELEDQDDPQVIFETLNARGQPLLPSDLLRNYIFLRATSENGDPDQATALYRTHWLPFDDPFWQEKERQGRLHRPRTDIFLQHYLSLKRCSEIPATHLYGEYREWIQQDTPFPNVEKELKELAQHREFYRSLLSPPEGTGLGRIAKFLRAFDSTTAYPLVLGILDQELDEVVEDEIFRAIESYLVRRAVCGLTSKNYNRVFMQMLSMMPSEALTADVFRQLLGEMTGESSIWPRGEAFKHAWLTSPSYNALGSRRAAWILRSIERAVRAKKSERIRIESKLSIEHVLPQEWIDNWPLESGTRGATFEELEDISRDLADMEATRTRNNILHTFGNLTLVTQPLNSALSNSGYLDKKPELLKFSSLALNQYFQDIDHWNEGAIHKRGEELFTIAANIWGHPQDAIY